MQNRTDIVGVSLWERLRQLLRSNKGWLLHIGAVAGGALLSNSYILGGVSPFGVAFCSAVNGGYAISAGLGAILGYTFSPGDLGNMKYIVAVVMVLVAQWLFGSKTGERYRTVVSSAISVISLGVAATAVLISTNATLYDVVISAAELFLVCGATYFFARAIAVAQTGWQSATRSDLSCIIIALAVALMGFTSIEVGGLSLGRIISVVVILLCARYGREAGGAISGVTAGMALSLVSGDPTYILVAYSFGGLIAGVFGGMGRIATAASFIFINTITALFTMEYLDVYNAIFEIFAATVVFIAIPKGWIHRIGLHTIAMGKDRSSDKATQSALCRRMDDISEALKEISSTTQQVSDKLGTMEQNSYTAIYTRVAEQVCYHCGLKTTCWQFKYSDTVAAMNDAISVLKRDGIIGKDKMSKHFLKTCCKTDEFIASLNMRFHDYVAKEGVQRKVSKVRGVVTDQFEGMALMMDEIAGELGNMQLLEPGKSKLVRDYLERQGIQVKQVLCYTDEYDRITVELHIPGYHIAKLHKAKLVLDLGGLLEADFDLPQIIQREKYTSVILSEKACFTIEVGAAQISAGGNKLCGDAYDFIRCKNGQSHLILSDGMGSGGSAAVDSAMASGLISRLISVGIGHEAALKMVSSALLIKSGEESLATIDICTLDLFTGKAGFYKAGAAPTYIVKNGKAGYVESTSLPAGILRGVSFEQSWITLHEGDLVVMISDGVIASGSDWIISELESLKGGDVQLICDKLANTAKLRRTDGREDDITVLAALMQKGA